MLVKSFFSALILSAMLVVITAMTGMLFLPGAWYVTLNKPFWTPPNYVFPLVWSTLYLIDMYVGAWVMTRGTSKLQIIWLLQLIFNALWSYLVFGQHQLLLGAIDILLLWMSLFWFVKGSFEKDKKVSFLFLLYLIWVSIALSLNVSLWLLNS